MRETPQVATGERGLSVELLAALVFPGGCCSSRTVEWPCPLRFSGRLSANLALTTFMDELLGSLRLCLLPGPRARIGPIAYIPSADPVLHRVRSRYARTGVSCGRQLLWNCTCIWHLHRVT